MSKTMVKALKYGAAFVGGLALLATVSAAGYRELSH